MRVGMLVAAGAVAAIVGVIGPLAQADVDPLQQRETLMKSLGDHSKALRGQVADPSSLPQVATAAEDIATKAEQIPELFPPGSEGGDALPAIWQNKADFDRKAARLKELATALNAAADTGDAQATTAAFAAMGREGCGSCHQTYRKPQS